MKSLVIVLLTLGLFSCASVPSDTELIREAIVYHEGAAPMVKLGMAEESFVSLMRPGMMPTERERLPKRFSRADDMFVVHFVRTAHVADGLLTDDEYQPYTFMNGKLVAVGWEYLGGATYTSQDLRQREAAADKTNVNTNVNVAPQKNYFKCKKDGGDSWTC